MMALFFANHKAASNEKTKVRIKLLIIKIAPRCNSTPEEINFCPYKIIAISGPKMIHQPATINPKIPKYFIKKEAKSDTLDVSFFVIISVATGNRRAEIGPMMINDIPKRL